MATITEILTAAENDIRSIMQHKDNRYLRGMLECAYIKEKAMTLPEGEPPFKANSMEEAQVEPGIFWQIAKKIDMFQRDMKTMPKMTQVRIENSFIQALESLSAKDAQILIAIKNQTLHKIFKGVTLKALKEVGYFQ